MKTMRLKYWIMMLLCMLVVSACSKDDDGSSEAGNSGKKLVSRMTVKSNDGTSDIKLTYDKKGRITKLVDYSRGVDGGYDYEDEYTYEYNFEDGIVSENETRYDIMRDETVYVVHDNGLNDRGFINCCWLGNIMYDQDNYIKEVRDFETSENVIATFFWRNGNIDRIEGKFDPSGSKYQYEYEWLSEENKCNIDFFYLLEWKEFEDLGYLDAMGYYGRTNRNLLCRAENSNGITTYSYDIDEKGYVVRIIRKENGNTEYWNIEYKD